MWNLIAYWILSEDSDSAGVHTRIYLCFGHATRKVHEGIMAFSQVYQVGYLTMDEYKCQEENCNA